MVLCECGCGEETTIYRGKPNRFIHGHNRRDAEISDETKLKLSRPRKTHVLKAPLPDGWKSKLSDITDNKECAVYLGRIAETILANIYTNVQVMPYGNSGFDVICNRDFKIDIKASATGDKRGYWSFKINKNDVADYFLCIAFNSRDDLHNPVHLWMIPADKINHLTAIVIRKHTLDKWQQYELPLDKLVVCCDNLSDNADKRADRSKTNRKDRNG